MTSAQKLRVVVADDHPSVRQGLRMFIDDEPDMHVDGESRDGSELLLLLRSQSFDVVLLDISMPKKNGIDCLKTIRQLYPALRVLIVSSYAEEQYALNMIRSGANGYICKDSAPGEIIRAIRTVADGGVYVSQAIASQLLTAMTSGVPQKPHESLSGREYQIFYRLARGMQVGQIASELDLSVKTVSTYRARVLEKLKLDSNASLTRYSVDNDLLD